MCPPVGPRAPKNHPPTPGATAAQVPQRQQQMMLPGVCESIQLGKDLLLEPPSPAGRGKEGPQTPLTGTAQAEETDGVGAAGWPWLQPRPPAAVGRRTACRWLCPYTNMLCFPCLFS